MKDIEIVPSVAPITEQKTYIECPKCGDVAEVDISMVLTSYPPQYQWSCPHCGATGYMSSIRNLIKPSSEWIACGIPITMMMNIERRNGENKPVIKKALVELDGKPFKKFAEQRREWAMSTCYTYPGPIQYFGPTEVCDQPSRTLYYEHGGE